MTTKEHHQQQREPDLRELARRYGIESTYKDGTGKQHVVPLRTLCQILSCMGVRVSSVADVQQALAEIEVQGWRKIIDDVVVVYPRQQQLSCLMTLPVGRHTLDDVKLELTLQPNHVIGKTIRCRGKVGKVVGEKMVQGVRHVRFSLVLPQKMRLGYYRLTVTAKLGSMTRQGKAFVIAAPRQCFLPVRPRRSWGIATQLYGLRSRRNWGIGDFRDLRHVIQWASNMLHAGTVGVNPLHAPTPGVISPYSPSSRLFLNPIYLAIESIQEFRTTPALQATVRSRPFQADLASARQSRLVDYDKVSALKWRMFERLFQAFRDQHEKFSTTRARAFKRFTEKGSRTLERFAVFQVLTEHFQTSAWREWPNEFRSPDSQTVEHFTKQHEHRVRFHQYLQWQCAEQLRAVDRTANRVRMTFGLYLDLPVGIHPDGADAWIFQHQLIEGIAVGAPPDSFNLGGQNWGLMAPHPLGMRAEGYQFFIETIRRNMRQGGVLRIDHALGLFRKFLVPAGGAGTDGAYVQFPVDELLAIVALESVRHRVMVIGEDLGTVTPAIKKRLAKAGLLSYRLLFFEKQPVGNFRRPEHYPAQALVAVTTHDLPTLRGYWAGRDIELKETLGMYPSSNHAERDWENRAIDRVALLRALVKEQIMPLRALKEVPLNISQELWQAIHVFLSRTPARMLVIPLEDLLGEMETPNFPGAPSHAYPSWRLKGFRTIESLMTDRTLEQVGKVVKRHQDRTSMKKGKVSSVKLKV